MIKINKMIYKIMVRLEFIIRVDTYQILKIIGRIISKKREKRPKVAMKTKGKINTQLTTG